MICIMITTFQKFQIRKIELKEREREREREREIFEKYEKMILVSFVFIILTISKAEEVQLLSYNVYNIYISIRQLQPTTDSEKR